MNTSYIKSRNIEVKSKKEGPRSQSNEFQSKGEQHRKNRSRVKTIPKSLKIRKR